MIERLLYDGNSPAKLATLPLVVAKDGNVLETDCLRGVLCIAIPGYIESEDLTEDWIYRVEVARKISMLYCMKYNIKILSEKKEIPPNYAVDLKNEDYELDPELPEEIIHVDSEKKFILDLDRIGYIKVVEREGANIFIDNKFEDLEEKDCEQCSYKKENRCNVYRSNKFPGCESLTNGFIDKGKGKYVDIQ